MVLEGFLILAIGMTTVALFFMLMIFVINLLHRIIIPIDIRYPEPLPLIRKQQQPAPAHARHRGDDEATVALAIAAAKRFSQ